MQAGDQVTPSIRLVRMLGQGGMGSVWVAEHQRLRTEVVVKFIIGEYATHPEALARFEREATLAAQAKSPHVVQVFDHGISEAGLPYIAMEFLEGEDLGARIKREKLIEPEVFVEWFRQAASGLSRAHKKGIVHRDIKPENIYLCNEDDEVLVKVLDFGIAKSDTASTSFSGTRTGAMLGTAYYMSPEQTMGSKSIDQRADLWAMGVVAYYALTGVRPFEAEAIGPLVMAITSGVITPPSHHNPALTAEIDAWMQKALARNPEERFPSAKEMSAALSGAVLGQVPSRSKGFGASSSSGAGTSAEKEASLDTGSSFDDTGSAPKFPRGTTLSAAVSVKSQDGSEPPPLPLTKGTWVGKAVAGGLAALAVALLAWGLSADGEESDPSALAEDEAPSSAHSLESPAVDSPEEPPQAEEPPVAAASDTQTEKPPPAEPPSARPTVAPAVKPAAPPPSPQPKPSSQPAPSPPKPSPRPKPSPSSPSPSPSTPLQMKIE